MCDIITGDQPLLCHGAPWHRGVPQGRPDQPSSLGRAIQGPSVPLSVECGASALKVHRILVLHLGMEMQS